MKTISFEIAKKMSRPPAGAPGIQLSSVKGDDMKAVMVISSADYAGLKERVSSMQQKGLPVSYRTRGKSLEITAFPGSGTGALSVLFSYAGGIDFALDDAADVMAFCAGAKDALGGRVKLRSIALDKDSLSLKAEAELEDDEEPESFYSGLMELLSKADMGVIKQ
ncbi:MAG: hypothetical protein IJM17_08380 [Firmicutes bacterium]|nr:hypothetical protein [Bacillota bacterium]